MATMDSGTSNMAIPVRKSKGHHRGSGRRMTTGSRKVKRSAGTTAGMNAREAALDADEVRKSLIKNAFKKSQMLFVLFSESQLG